MIIGAAQQYEVTRLIFYLRYDAEVIGKYGERHPGIHIVHHLRAGGTFSKENYVIRFDYVCCSPGNALLFSKILLNRGIVMESANDSLLSENRTAMGPFHNALSFKGVKVATDGHF